MEKAFKDTTAALEPGRAISSPSRVLQTEPVRTPLASLSDPRLRAELAEGWGIQAGKVEYRPLGGGSYHWIVRDDAGRRHFATADDLDAKPFLGRSRDSAFDGLLRALDTARGLRDEAGLEFIVAPLTTLTGETVRRIGPGLALALYPFLEGEPGRFGEALPPREKAELVRMLVRLHAVSPRALPHVRRASLSLPGRDDLERALTDVGREWSGGPLSEPARRLLAEHAKGVRRLLDRFDEMAGRLDASAPALVMTHGEPHGGNVIRTAEGLRLIDWDTVALAPPERDLWHVDTGTGEELRLYSEGSGRRVDLEALAFYRLRWTLDDLSIFLDNLRSPHTRNPDTEHALRAVTFYLKSGG
jgi:spectinomycin phosphotransferase